MGILGKFGKGEIAMANCVVVYLMGKVFLMMRLLGRFGFPNASSIAISPLILPCCIKKIYLLLC